MSHHKKFGLQLLMDTCGSDRHCPGKIFLNFEKKNIFENKNVFPFCPFIWEAIADIKISIHTDIYMGEEFCTIDYFGFHQQQKQTNHCVQTVMCWYAEHFLVKFLGPGKF